jgi:hypothetical protein
LELSSDSCALVPGRQRDFLLQLAAEGAYAPLWGTGILDGLDDVLEALDAARGRADSAERRRHLFDQMARYCPGATVDAPKDRTYDHELVGEASMSLGDCRDLGAGSPSVRFWWRT